MTGRFFGRIVDRSSDGSEGETTEAADAAEGEALDVADNELVEMTDGDAVVADRRAEDVSA